MYPFSHHEDNCVKGISKIATEHFARLRSTSMIITWSLNFICNCVTLSILKASSVRDKYKNKIEGIKELKEADRERQ
jgi:hypothetical protein